MRDGIVYTEWQGPHGRVNTGWRENKTVEMRAGRWLASSEYFKDGEPVYRPGERGPHYAAAICAKIGHTAEHAERERDNDKPIVERIYGIA
jgi:hypothetical protein